MVADVVVSVPGCKSIAHRALMLSSIAKRRSEIHGIPDGLDVQATLRAVACTGAQISSHTIDGKTVVGVQPSVWPARVDIDAMNAGTLARLWMGLTLGQQTASVISGDASLSSRPMQRVATALAPLCGQEVVELNQGRLPAQVRPFPMSSGDVEVNNPTGSAQVKSAVLLAALMRDGTTIIKSSHRSRDHSERLLGALGADIDTVMVGDKHHVRLHGTFEVPGFVLRVPGDPSSAAFAVVARVLCPGAPVVVTDVLVNPLRVGFLDVLRRMHAQVAYVVDHQHMGEPVGQMRATHGGALSATCVTANECHNLADEVPILAAAAAFATGDTVFEHVTELRVKESDRVAGIIDVLAAFGVRSSSVDAALVVHGAGKLHVPSRAIDVRGDHRLAMMVSVLAKAVGCVVATNADGIEQVSFPRFHDVLARIA
jgi:3-phosphoshikimate 1-carboxyvinyltransferase